MGDRSLELKVGAVLLVAVLALGGFVLALGDFSFSRGFLLYVDYAFSGAIQAGAPVKISGVRVGRVEELKFLGGMGESVVPPPAGEGIQVRLVLRLEDKAKSTLKQGARFFVNTQGLLGEHYVEIVPAMSPGPPLAEGSAERGVDPPRFDLLVQKIYDVLDGTQSLFRSDLGPLQELIKSAASLAKNADVVLKENQVEVHRTLLAAADATEQAAELMKGLKRAVGDGAKIEGTIDDVAAMTAILRKDLPASLAKVDAALASLDKVAAGAAEIDPKELTAIVKNARDATSEVNHVLGDARAITQRLRAGGGTVGLLLQDDEIYDDLKEMLKDLKQNPWKLVWKQ
ncbi:MAG: MlaD family protein [Myxococcota bacterium]